MNKDHPVNGWERHSYLLQTWSTGRGGGKQWRFMVTNVESGQVYGFDDISALTGFFTDPPKGSEKRDESESNIGLLPSDDPSHKGGQ